LIIEDEPIIALDISLVRDHRVMKLQGRHA
jgi:hypothetical protein